ncbi:MAG: hypothetical protein CM15mV29_0570 [uncultured marine virus]|jgi:hypothetical protein|nr:MAG: hypothetical protein CM15mV29_0570 [uncultured marine virus]
MSCPYQTGECEWPQDCEDCNPDLYAERCDECNGQVHQEDWEDDPCTCEEEEEEVQEVRPLTYDEKVQMWKAYRMGWKV